MAALVLLLALALTDAIVRIAFPTSSRLSENFSSAYVRLEMQRLRGKPGLTIVLGDSVLWGYRLRPDETVTALLSQHRAPVVNLAYEGGSPVNTYAMLRLLLTNGVRPARVVFNVNQKVFSAADSAYARVHPSIWALASDAFSTSDRALVAEPPEPGTPDAALDAAITGVWELYALRTDLREMLFGDIDAAHALHDLEERADGAQARRDAEHVPTADAYAGAYDLSPIDRTNVSAHFLERVAGTLRAAHIPALAILTPTNHALLHDYIDTPQYRRNLETTRALLARTGVRILDLDRAFGPRDFLDNDHLTATATARFARILARELPAG